MMHIIPASITLLLLFSATTNGFVQDSPVPTYTVNLDLPAKERWAEIGKAYGPKIAELNENLVELIPSNTLIQATAIFAAHLLKCIPQPYQDELLGLAQAANVSVGELVAWNLLYDITAYNRSQEGGIRGGCTSIVAEDSNGTIFHGRNLDYSIAQLLSDILITVEFQEHGETVYTGTTFAGYVGLLTAQKPNRFTISLNQRDKGAWWKNSQQAAKIGTNGIINFVIRDILADPNSDFNTAVNKLSNVPLIAPCYLIVGGVHSGEGVVITRNQTGAVKVRQLDASKGQWYILQTNYDYWEQPPFGDDRRDPGIKAMNQTGQKHINLQSLYKVLSTVPVLNSDTLYTTTMSAAQPRLYQSTARMSSGKFQKD